VADYDRIRDHWSESSPGSRGLQRPRVKVAASTYLTWLCKGKFEKLRQAKPRFTHSSLPTRTRARMMTIRSHDQFVNTTIYGLEDRYCGIHNERLRCAAQPRRHAPANLLKAGRSHRRATEGRGERVANHFIVTRYRSGARRHHPENQRALSPGLGVWRREQHAIIQVHRHQHQAVSCEQQQPGLITIRWTERQVLWGRNLSRSR